MQTEQEPAQRFANAWADAFNRHSRTVGMAQRWDEMRPFAQAAIRDGLATVVPEGTVIVDPLRLWALIEAYGEARYAEGVGFDRSMFGPEKERDQAETDAAANAVRAALDLDPLP